MRLYLIIFPLVPLVTAVERPEITAGVRKVVIYERYGNMAGRCFWLHIYLELGKWIGVAIAVSEFVAVLSFL